MNFKVELCSALGINLFVFERLRVGESDASEDTGATCKQGPRGDYMGNEYQCSGEAIGKGPPVVTAGRE